MSKHLETDILVIGGGSGGLSVAAGAAQMGVRVVLMEKGKMGGDCLNYGCVPSKALLAAAKAAHAVPHAAIFGIDAGPVKVDFRRVHDHVHGVIAGIAPHDSVERFESFGVRVIEAAGKFVGPREVAAGDHVVRAKRIVIATGSTARVPPIPGLDGVPYMTNETIFDLVELPDHLIIVGAGPIGLEMAQAFRRLGSKVTVLEKFRALPKDDPELAAILLDSLRKEGVVIREEVDIAGISGTAGAISVDLGGEVVAGSHILMATGRAPVLEGLDLGAAGIAYEKSGIPTDARLRTSNKRVFAIGDCRGGLQFTHVAGYEAGIVIRNALFRLPAKADYGAVPWVTYTDPELAHVGLDEAMARQRHGDRLEVLRFSFADNDRARAERATTGMIKMMAAGGRVVGVSIVGAQAGELIQLPTLALAQRIKISAIAGYISPYPTLGELNKRVAGSLFTKTLFGERTRKLTRLLMKLG